MAITKGSLTDFISESCDCSKPLSSKMLEFLLEIIKRTLESGEEILISGFGKFCVKDKKKRRGRNPETGDDMILDARRIVTFKCSNTMRDKINGKG